MLAKAEQIWRRGLEALAARNGPADLSPAGDGEGAADYFRSRILGLGADGEILVERPGVAGISTAMAVGKAVHVTLMADGQRWQGTARVRGLEAASLNGAVTVPALRLSPATEIRSGQRRQFYRIALSSLDIEGLTLAAEGSAGSVKPLAAQVVNLSAGGLGARLPAGVRPGDVPKRGEALRCTIPLLGARGDVAVRARLVHVEPLPERAIYLGLQFEFDDPAAKKRIQDDLARFVTDVERKQLRRTRGAA